MDALLVLAQNSGGGSPLSLIILLLPIAAIIYLTVIPQRKQRQKQAELLRSLAEGDEVVTIGGMRGVINAIDDDVVHLEVDNDVVVRIERAAIARNAAEPEPAAPAARRRGSLFAPKADPEDADSSDASSQKAADKAANKSNTEG